MNLEKIFKNLILANIGMFVLIIISAYFQNSIILFYSLIDYRNVVYAKCNIKLMIPYMLMA